MYHLRETIRIIRRLINKQVLDWSTAYLSDKIEKEKKYNYIVLKYFWIKIALPPKNIL